MAGEGEGGGAAPSGPEITLSLINIVDAVGSFVDYDYAPARFAAQSNCYWSPTLWRSYNTVLYADG